MAQQLNCQSNDYCKTLQSPFVFHRLLFAKTGAPLHFENVTFENKTQLETVIFTLAPVSCIGSAGICLHYC